MLQAAKRVLRARFGIFPILELRNKLQHPFATLGLYRAELRESRQLLERLGGPVVADIVTIIPTYRRPDLVRDAVASALAQRVGTASHRVIVVDDGGGDVEPFEDVRVRVVTLARNTASAGVVRNIGIRVSASPIIAFLDDDNRWLPNHLETTIPSLQRGADLVYTGIRRFGPDGTLIDELSVPFRRDALRERAYVDTSAIVCRRGGGVNLSTAGGLRRGRREFHVQGRGAARQRDRVRPGAAGAVRHLTGAVGTAVRRWNRPGGGARRGARGWPVAGRLRGDQQHQTR